MPIQINKDFGTRTLGVVARERPAQMLYVAASADSEVSRATNNGSWATQAWEACLGSGGADRDRNGIGDTPYEAYLFADRIWMETPMATFFRNSPAFELLDFLERLAPFSLPYRVFQDAQPRMR